MSAEPAPARRADAERNRSKIIAVAREAFTEPGAAPSMAEIARRAGVGMATLYRNFPGRLELVEELFRHTVDDMCQAAESVSGDTPGEAFFAWLMRFHAIGARKGPLASVLLSESANGTPSSAPAAPAPSRPANPSSAPRNAAEKYATTSLSGRSSTASSRSPASTTARTSPAP
ncbi:TetR/AcrR family transcriptional regulator [Streptomyces sp. Tue 6430]|nr:TetR/AcrR family transcriptional regulator [Streptomyces sp. Tue 6430]